MMRKRSRARLTIRGADVVSEDGVLVTSISGERAALGRAPAGVVPEQLDLLTISSASLSVMGGFLFARCSGPCALEMRVLDMGLRNMGAGSFRNQPRCVACRHVKTNTSETAHCARPALPRAVMEFISTLSAPWSSETGSSSVQTRNERGR